LRIINVFLLKFPLSHPEGIRIFGMTQGELQLATEQTEEGEPDSLTKRVN